MPYDYDYFISYAHADNKSEDDKSGFVDEFVNELRNSEEHQQMFGGKINVFFDKTEIHNMSDWDNVIRSKLASSRFLIVLLSPGYFQSEYCAREFDWWIQHEMHRRILGEGIAPMRIVDVASMYDYQTETIPVIPADLQARFPNWLSQIRKIQSGPQFDMHDLDRAKISDALDSLRSEVKDKVQRQDAAEKSPHTGQYPQYNQDFVGRRENLRSLRKSLSEKAAATYSALTGLGGFGKTELALTYGHAFAWDYQLGRVFAKCENKTSLIDILLTSGIAEMHGWELPKGSEEQQITFLFNRLETLRNEIVQRNEKEGNLNTLGAHILLILDNVNKLELISKKNLAVLPDFFHVIITTRENANEFPHIHSEPVERLSEDESVELLSNLHPFDNIDEANAARNIAKLLAGFTLTVELTGAYLNKNKHITYQKQYDRLVNDHAKTIQTIADKTGDLTRHDAQTVAAVLESTLSALSPNARKALDFAAIMAPDTVALGWLPELLGLDEDEGWEVHDELVGYSLLTPLENEPNIARMHSLVSETVKQDIPSVDAMGKICGTLFEKIASLLKKDETFWCTPENSWNITPIYEFCMTLADRWTVEAVDNESNRFFAKMLDRSGDMLKTLGKIKEAKEVFQRLSDICKTCVKSFPENINVQLDLRASYHQLAMVEHLLGNVKIARSWFEKAIEIDKRLVEIKPEKEQVSRLLHSYIHLGNLEVSEGNISASLEWNEKALEIAQQLNDKMSDNDFIHCFLLILYEQLGDTEKSSGNIAEAREWYNKALEIKKQINFMSENYYGQLGLIITYFRLGILEWYVGNTDAAREWFEKELEISQRLAETMPQNILILQFLGNTYVLLGALEYSSGNTVIAKTLLEKGLTINQQHVQITPENILTPLLSLCYTQLGVFEKDRGNTDGAKRLFEKALDMDKRLIDLMPENVIVQMSYNLSYNLLGDMEKDAGNMEAARTLFEKALENNKQLANAKQENVTFQNFLSDSYLNIGKLEQDAGNTTVAREWLEKSLEIRQRLADKMPENVTSQRNLSEVYFNLGSLEFASNNAAKAKEWCNKALTILKQVINKIPDNVESQMILGKVYRCLGDSENADGNIKIAQDWYEKSLNALQQLATRVPDNVQVQKELADTQKKLDQLHKQP